MSVCLTPVALLPSQLAEVAFLGVFLVKLTLSRLETLPGKTGSGPAMSPAAREVLLERMLVSTPDPQVAIGETVILLHPPLPLAGVTIGMERGCQ